METRAIKDVLTVIFLALAILLIWINRMERIRYHKMKAKIEVYEKLCPNINGRDIPTVKEEIPPRYRKIDPELRQELLYLETR